MQAYLNRLTQARQQRLTDIARLDTALVDTEQALAERQTRLDALADELEAQSALLARRTEERRSVVTTLDDRYESEADRLADLSQSREQAEQQLRAIQAELARLAEPTPTTHITRTQGDLPWPVQGSITASFQLSAAERGSLQRHRDSGQRRHGSHGGSFRPCGVCRLDARVR